ncbi:hypothetical protein CEXT_372621 [Caerostris extrusa]|uniref:Uncharacterized protein n=1 Tax=Caerostris extrusa TaxID=172846 RepID=A0AAV4TUD4_CAEEX|nr:hypothetical protein CEXT_372621 [Caerostris extrusa]
MLCIFIEPEFSPNRTYCVSPSSCSSKKSFFECLSRGRLCESSAPIGQGNRPFSRVILTHHSESDYVPNESSAQRKVALVERVLLTDKCSPFRGRM